MSITIGDLIVKLRADNREVGPALQQVENALTGVERTVRRVAQATERSFLDISGDVKRANAAFSQGKISIDIYRTVLDVAGREATQLAHSVKPVGVELGALNQVMRATGRESKAHVHGLGMLRSQLGSLAATTAGLPGAFGSFSSVLSSFAMGSLAGAGVFAGLAGIGLALRKITEHARKAREEQEKLVETLKKLARGRAEETDPTLAIREVVSAGRAKAETARRAVEEQERAILDERMRMSRMGVQFENASMEAKLARLKKNYEEQVRLVQTGEAEIRRAMLPPEEDPFEAWLDRRAKLREKEKEAFGKHLRIIESEGVFGKEPEHNANLLMDMAQRAKEAVEALKGVRVAYSDIVESSAPKKIEEVLNVWATAPRSIEGTASALDAINRILAETGTRFDDLIPSLREYIQRMRQPPDAGFFEGLKANLKNISKTVLDPTLIISNLVSGGLSSILSAGLGLLGKGVGAVFAGFGGDDAARARAEALNEALKRNREALERNTDAIAARAGGLMGGDIAKALGLIDRLLNPGNPFFGPAFRLTEEQFEFLAELAKDLGIDFIVTVDGLNQFKVTLNEVVAQSLKGFSGGFSLLQREFDLLDITDPAERFRRGVQFVAGLLDTGLGLEVLGLNAGNIDEFIRSFMESLRKNTFDFETLGSLSLEQFIEFLSFAEGSLDELANSANSASEALRNVPTGFKIALRRFEATMGVPSTTTTGMPGSLGPAIAMAQGVTISGPVTIVANDPQELYQRTMAEARRQRRRGGTSALDVSSQPMRFTGGP